MKKISGTATDGTNQLAQSAIAVITRRRNVVVRAAAFINADADTNVLEANQVMGVLKVGQNTYTMAFIPIIPGRQNRKAIASNVLGQLAVDLIGLNDECTIYAGDVEPSAVDGGNLSLTFTGFAADSHISVMWDVLYA